MVGMPESLRQSGDVGAFAQELTQRVKTLGPVEPAPLAQLLHEAAVGRNWGRVVLNAIHTLLLRRTLEHARQNTMFYREVAAYARWSEVPPGCPPDLTCWPILSRHEVAENAEKLIAQDVRLRSICHTSGTTGKPLEVYKSFEEVDFIARYFQSVYSAILPEGLPRPLSLSFPNFNHGVPVPFPSPGMGFAGGVTDDTLIMDALRIIQRKYSIAGFEDRISVLSGLGHHVLLFTSFLAEQGIDPKSLGLVAVNITGGYQAKRWREFLWDAWGPVVNDRFTLTEAMAGASRIGDSSRFVFDPHIIAEVLDPDSLEPTQGVGLLVLTNLAPFVLMHPLIRYNTGDLVLPVEDDRFSTLTFEFLGRQKNCVGYKANGRCEWLIFSTALHDLLCDLPDIRIYDWFSNVRTVKDCTVGSLPIVSVDSEARDDKLRLTLSAELRYAPATHPRRIKELKAHITSALRACPNTTFARRLDRGDVEFTINFFPPKGLGRGPEIKI